MLFRNDLKLCKKIIFKIISVLLNNECLMLNGSPRIKLHGDDIDGVMINGY